MPQLENLGEQPALSWGTPHGTTVFFSWTWQPMLIPSFFFLMPLHRTTAVFNRKLDVKDTQVWACAMNSCHATGEQAASCLPCPAALLHCSCKQCPKCAEPSGVWKDSLPALSWAPAWLPQNTESRALLSSKGLCPSPAHHEAAFHSSLPSDPLALWQDQTVNRVLARDVKKQYGNGLQNCCFFSCRT